MPAVKAFAYVNLIPEIAELYMLGSKSNINSGLGSASTPHQHAQLLD